MGNINIAFNDIMGWIHKIKLKSYDPYDVISSPIYDFFEQNKPKSGILSKYSVYTVEKKFPKISRIICPKRKSTTSSSIYASSCYRMYDLTHDEKWKIRGEKELLWLINNKSTYPGSSWGLPFVWNMGNCVYAPVGTPYSTISIYMIDAFNDGFKHSYWNEYKPNYFDVLVKSHILFTDQLKILEESDDSLYLSYSPLDNLKVINVQSYAAVALYATRWCRELINSGKDPYLEFSNKLTNTVIKEQSDDGSWNYWGKDDKRHSVDSLHQCYIMQNLYRCYLMNKDDRILSAVNTGIEYYLKNYIEDEKIRKFPIGLEGWFAGYELIDIAEATRLFMLLDNKKYTDMCINSMISNFKIENKPYFISCLNDNRRIGGIDDIPYLRWGQTQAALAMGEYLCKKDCW